MSRMRILMVGLAAAALTVSGCTTEQDAAEPSPDPTAVAPTTPGEPTDSPQADPSPDTDPSPSEPSSPSSPDSSDGTQLTEANLPTADDLEWHDAGDWEAVEGATDPDAIPEDTCQQQPWQETGSGVAVLDRTFTLAGGGDRDVAHAVVLQYADEDAAEQAYETVRDWSRDCTEDGVEGVPGSQTEVDVPAGTAEFSEWSQIDEAADSGSFTMIGVTHRETRVAWVLMQIEGQDNNWDYEPDGPVGALHPMIRSLPQVNTRLG